jgi:uncharacterized repeat protein (TIGR04076 family)
MACPGAVDSQEHHTGSFFDEAQGSPIEIWVIEIRGRRACPLGLRVGDLFRSDRQIGAVCHWASHALLPWTTALRFGGDVPWESEPGLARVCCPDPDNVVVFEVRRSPLKQPTPAGEDSVSRRFVADA